MKDRAPTAPLRTCVGCGRTAPRASMALRVAAARDGVLRTGEHAPGRGAWFCGKSCVEPALRRGRLDRALRRRGSSDEHAALRARLGI